MSYILDQWRRASPDLADLTDEQLIPIVHQATGDARPLRDFATAVGYQAPESDLGKEFSAGVSNWKAGFQHIGAAAGSETAAQWAEQNEARARLLRGMSNAPQSYEDVEFGHPDKGVLNYVGTLAAGSVPYLGEMAVGAAFPPAAAVRVGAAGLRAGIGAGSATRIASANVARGMAPEAAEAAARASVAKGHARSLTGAAASYPSAVGDVLSNQHEQAGTYDGGAAAALGVPYAALNLLGLEGAVARRGVPVASSIQNRAGRAMATGALTGASESINETGQEVINQFGRMAVDPNASIDEPDALRRYRESAVGGFALGKTAGTAVGAFSKYQPLGNQTGAVQDAEQPQEEPLALGYEPQGFPNRPYQALTYSRSETPLALGHELSDYNSAVYGPGMIAFPDGTIGSRADIDGYLQQFPEDIQPRIYEQLIGLNKLKTTDTAAAALQEGQEVDLLGAGNNTQPAQDLPARVQDQPRRSSAPDYDAAAQLAQLTGQQQSSQPLITPDNIVSEAQSNWDNDPAEMARAAYRDAFGKQRANQPLTLAEQFLLRQPAPEGTFPQVQTAQERAPRSRFKDQPTEAIPDVFGPQGPRPAAPVTPTAPPVQAAAPGQAEMFDAAGRPTYAAEQEADDATVAKQFGIEFGIKPTEKRAPLLAKAGRAYYDGAIDFDTAQGIALNVQSGKMAKAQRDLDAAVAAPVSAPAAPVAEPAAAPAPVQPAPSGDVEIESAPVARPAPVSPVSPAPAPAVVEEDSDVGVLEKPETTQALAPKEGFVAELETLDDQIADLRARRAKLTRADGMPRKGNHDAVNKLDTALENLEWRKMEIHAENTGTKLEDGTIPNAEEAFDSDIYHDGESPKFADLTPDLKKRWEKAVDHNEANQELHDFLTNEQKKTNSNRAKAEQTQRELEELSKGLTKYRRSGGGEGMTQAKAASVVDAMRRMWKNAPEIEVVATMDDLPESLRAQAEADGAMDAKGAFVDGKVWIVAANNANPHDVVVTVLHEVTGHAGLRGLLGSQLEAEMMRLYNGNPDIRAAADVRVKRDKLDKATAVEEVLADAAQQGKIDPTWLEKVANVVRRVMRRIGLGKYADGVTAGEIKELLSNARRHIENGDGGGSGGKAVYRKDAAAQPGDVPELAKPAGFVANLIDSVQHLGTNKTVLGLLTMRQLADRFSTVPGVQRFTNAMQAMSARASTLQKEVADIDRMWEGLGNLTEQRPLMKVMLEATLEQMHVDLPFDHDLNKHIDRVKKPEFEALQKQFNALDPKAKAIYVKAREKFKADWDEQGRLIRQRIVDQYVPELGELANRAKDAKGDERKAVMAGTTSEAERRSLRKMWDDLDAHGTTLAQMRGPYFPLMRFGDHVVVAKSKELRDATKAYDDAKDALTKLYAQDDGTYTDEDLAAAKKDVSKARSLLENYKRDENHYRVEFFEKRVDAKKRMADLSEFYSNKFGQYGFEVESKLREEHFKAMDTPPFAFMQKLESAVKGNLPAKDANAIEAAIRQIYIQSMPERSALKSQLRRIGTAGVKEGEMRRALVAAGLRNSFNISRLEYGNELNDALGSLRRGKTDEEKEIGGEFSRRMIDAMQPMESNRYIDAASNLSYVTFLGLSPSFIILNMSQPFTVSLPLMAARHGTKGSSVELGKSYFQAFKLLQQSWGKPTLDMTGLAQDEKIMLDELMQKGVIDVTQEYDLGALAAGRDETWDARLTKLAAKPAHITEMANRIGTALAAFRLEKKNGLSGAIAYAEKIVADTHLDYTVENSPRLLRSQALGGLGKLVFQFKKYQQGMIFLTFKLMRDSYRDGKMDKESMKAFSYLMGAQIGVAGVAATPFTGLLAGAAAIYGALQDDDEDKEFRQRFYEGLKDTLGETGARLVMKGAPAALGVDVSNRLGLGDALNPLKFAPDTDNGRDWMAHALLALAGPAASMTADWVNVMKADDPQRAAMNASPRAIKGVLKAMEEAENGLLTTRGNQYQAPEEVDGWDTLLTGIGFKSTDRADLEERRRATDNAVYARDDARRNLISQYAKARLRGEDLDGVMQEIAEFNERHGAGGGGVRINQSTLQRSLVAQRRYERDLKNGVRVRRQDEYLAEALKTTE